MNQKEIVKMSKKELDRLKVIHQVMDKGLKQKEAARKLSLTVRQIRNIVRKVREKGDRAVIHGNRGKQSNRRYSDKFRKKVIRKIEGNYEDCGPTFTAEKLRENHGIEISKETARKWMIQQGFWEPRSKKDREKNRVRRERKRCFGEMVQTDGSIENWFEDRGPKAVLMAYIDDATNIAFGRFYPSENTEAAMDSFMQYIEKYGIPQALYFDRNSIYKTTREPSIDEQLKNEQPRTQFGKAMKILDVDQKYAYTPQAKGRIERLFKTLQDRLIKELSLEGINTLEEGNKFLDTYFPKFNEKFSVAPRKEKNLHREVPEEMDLKWVFAFRDKRTVSKDFTVRWRNRVFLIKQHSCGIKNQKVEVLESLDGELKIWLNSRVLEYKEITEQTVKKLREKKTERQKEPYEKGKQPWSPSEDHPWRGKNRALFAESNQ